MTRGILVAFAVALAVPVVHAQELARDAQNVAPEAQKLRNQIHLMEGLLARAGSLAAEQFGHRLQEIEPTMSVKRMVTGLRSPSIFAAARRILSCRVCGANCRSASSRSDDPVKDVPHCLQNLAFVLLDVPQLGQARSRNCPQFWQNRASGGLSREQLSHFILK